MAYGIFRRQALALSGGRMPLWAAWCAILLLLAGGVGCAFETITDLGIGRVGVTDGRVMAQGREVGLSHRYFHYETGDGGLTWHPVEVSRALKDEIRDEFTATQVSTPRGEYRIEGAAIEWLAGGAAPVAVYRLPTAQNSNSLWMQARSTEDLGSRRPATQPGAIAYDPGSGNVIAALGIEGVVVGTDDGRWIPAPVGPYRPTDFSAAAKTRMLLTWFPFLILAASFTLVTLNMTLAAAYLFRRGAAAEEDGCDVALAIPGVGMSMGASVLLLPLLGAEQFDTYPFAEITSAALAILFVLPWQPLIAFVLWPRRWALKWRVAFASLGGAALLVFLTYFAWLQLGGDFRWIKAGSALLCLAIALLLGRYLESRNRESAGR